jgi:hypothetical protein
MEDDRNFPWEVGACSKKFQGVVGWGHLLSLQWEGYVCTYFWEKSMFLFCFNLLSNSDLNLTVEREKEKQPHNLRTSNLPFYMIGLPVV